MNVSINPTYYCNFRCDFCYLTEQQLSDVKCLPISKMEKLLDELERRHYDIDVIDLYGGELGLLSNDYLERLIDLCLKRTPVVNIITNGSAIRPAFLRPDVELFISYDFAAREKHQVVLQNMLKADRDINIITLATPLVMSYSVDYMINTLKHIKNLKSFEIKPYSPNQANRYDFNNKDYEQFIQEFIVKTKNVPYTFINRLNLDNTLASTRRSYSDDHIYITPQGKFAVLEFDDNHHEYFKQVTLLEYAMWCTAEPLRYDTVEPCASCEYRGRCLTEHLKPVVDFENKSCSGFYNLIKWYEENEQHSRTN